MTHQLTSHHNCPLRTERPPCKCGSTTHELTTHSDCPLREQHKAEILLWKEEFYRKNAPRHPEAIVPVATFAPTAPPHSHTGTCAHFLRHAIACTCEHTQVQCTAVPAPKDTEWSGMVLIPQGPPGGRWDLWRAKGHGGWGVFCAKTRCPSFRVPWRGTHSLNHEKNYAPGADGGRCCLVIRFCVLLRSVVVLWSTLGPHHGTGSRPHAPRRHAHCARWAACRVCQRRRRSRPAAPAAVPPTLKKSQKSDF